MVFSLSCFPNALYDLSQGEVPHGLGVGVLYCLKAGDCFVCNGSHNDNGFPIAADLRVDYNEGIEVSVPRAGLPDGAFLFSSRGAVLQKFSTWATL
jgi:hypothetical protein